MFNLYQCAGFWSSRANRDNRIFVGGVIDHLVASLAKGEQESALASSKFAQAWLRPL